MKALGPPRSGLTSLPSFGFRRTVPDLPSNTPPPPSDTSNFLLITFTIASKKGDTYCLAILLDMSQLFLKEKKLLYRQKRELAALTILRVVGV